MEAWQEKLIVTNMDKLIKNTTCKVSLLAKLQASGVLSEEDVEEVVGLGSSRQTQSHKFYSIMLRRLNSFDVLVEGLQETNQSGALLILLGNTQTYDDFESVTFDEKTILGKGSYGNVYKGKFGERDIAIKRIQIDELDSPQVVQEINILKSCDMHENIVRYFGSKRSHKYFLILLELCELTLSSWVKQKSIDVSPVEVLRQATVGLDWLHEHKIVHRDLKPDNILFTRNPSRIKISDFGLSRKIIDGRSFVSASVVAGTQGWVAPEILTQALQENPPQCKFTFASDIFALGCVFYFVMTNGKHPFGDIFRCQGNILDGKPVLDENHIVNGCQQNILFVKLMISHNPKSRPSCRSLLACPIFWTTNDHILFILNLNLLNTEAMGPCKTIQICSNCAVHHGQGNDLLRRMESLNRISLCGNNATYLLHTNLKTSQYYTSDAEFQIQEISEYLDCKSQTLTATKEEETKPKQQASSQIHPQKNGTSSKSMEVSVKTPLSPIIFQISLNRLGVAIELDENLKLYPSIPTVVGVKLGNEWICGSEVEANSDKNSQRLIHIWKIGDYLSGNKAIPRVEFDKAGLNINTELLLAYLLYTEKGKVEHDLQGRITGCIIIVPFWFTSFQRQQVIDAGNIAGFYDIQLVNENTAIAYHAVKTLKSNYDILVVSENSSMLDATVYRFDCQKDMFKMIAHHGDYNISRKPGSENDAVGKLSKEVEKQIWLAEGSLIKGIFRKEPQRIVYTLCESSNWKLIHKYFRDINTPTTSFTDFDNVLAVSGAWHYVRKSSSKCLLERSCYDIYVKTNSRRNNCFYEKEEELPLYGTKINILKNIPTSGEYLVFQKHSLFETERKIGVLTIKGDKKQCRFVLLIDHRGIVSFHNLNTDPQLFSWSSANLADCQVTQYRDAIHMNNPLQLMINHQQKPTYELVNKFETLLEQIINGDVGFRSELAKAIFISQIEESLKVLAGSTTPEDITTKSDMYCNIMKKVFPNNG